MAVSTLRGAFSQYFRPREEKRPEPPGNMQEREYLLWRILQQEGGSLVGMALWMSWKLNMQPGEILELTWPQVDFDRDVITLPDREIPMGSRLSRQLRDTWDHRRDPASPASMLAPATGPPHGPCPASPPSPHGPSSTAGWRTSASATFAAGAAG